MTEIRDFGDGKTIIIYTNDNKVSQRLRDRKNLLKTIEYTQDQKKGTRLIGIDYYFPKRQLRSILRGLGLSTSKTFRLTRFHQIKI